MFIYKTAKFAPVWTIILKIRTIFIYQTLTEHALFIAEWTIKWLSYDPTVNIR